MMQSLIYLTLTVVIMTMYNSSPEDQHFKAIEDHYYRELDEQHQYEVALDQWVKGELECKPEQPFTVFV